jgi:hypothetical protein
LLPPSNDASANFLSNLSINVNASLFYHIIKFSTQNFSCCYIIPNGQVLANLIDQLFGFVFYPCLFHLLLKLLVIFKERCQTINQEIVSKQLNIVWFLYIALNIWYTISLFRFV